MYNVSGFDTKMLWTPQKIRSVKKKMYMMHTLSKINKNKMCIFETKFIFYKCCIGEVSIATIDENIL